MLRAIENSSAVKLTIIIPLVGYLIIFNENVLHYIELSRELLGGHVIPLSDAATGAVAHVSWRLLCLYFGLCLIAGAAALHQLFCPEKVKKYGSPVEYISYEQGHTSERRFGHIERALEANARSVVEITALKRLWDGGPAADLNARRQEIMDLQYRTLDSSRPWARWAAGFLYAGGFVALTVPSVEIFVRVVILFVRTIVS